MSKLVFMLPFAVETSVSWVDTLTQLEMIPTRVDDWDLQMGFRLVGNTGAIRLLKRTTEAEGTNLAYALFGTAVSPEDRDQVKKLYWTCLNAVGSIGAQIDKEQLIDPKKTEKKNEPLEREAEF